MASVLDSSNDLAGHFEMDQHFLPADIHMYHRFTGMDYGIVGNLEREAIRLLAASEGVLLHPVDTGRAFGGMCELIREGTLTSRDSILF